MSEHTKEPWSIDDANGFPADVVCSDAIIARCAAIGPGVSWHNARRIVACVNACAGFADIELDGANLFADSIKSQTDIESLCRLLDEVLPLVNAYGDARVSDRIRAALAEVKS